MEFFWWAPDWRFALEKGSLWEILKSAIMVASHSPVLVIVVVEMLNNIWHEWNGIHYRSSHSQIPIWSLLQKSVAHVRALTELCNNNKERRWLEKDLEKLDRASKPPMIFVHAP